MADTVSDTVKGQIKNTHVLVYSKSTCPFCDRVKKLFNVQNVAYTAIELDQIENGDDIKTVLTELTNQKTVPNVFVNGIHVGGCDAVISSFSKGTLSELILDGTMKRDQYDPNHTFDYDLVVIGGGSGGLACAKEAASFEGTKVCCLDYVKPSPAGSKWGLGGTCVNVGCIPKKLMHQAALLGESVDDARSYGWEFAENVTHNWKNLKDAVQMHIKSLNWNYKTQLRSKNVKYINGLGQLIDSHTIKCVDKNGTESIITAARIVIAVGGRPRYPDIPGAREYCISSDDIFSLAEPPGDTLVVGASYVALECAGFLAKLGFNTSCMVRSILLRGFDQQMAEKVGEYMSDKKVHFLHKCVPTKIELISEGPPKSLRVHYKNLQTGKEGHADFNTVLIATGRDPDTRELGLDKAGVNFIEKTGYIPTIYEQTNIPNIYAIGDIQQNKLELTPLAIQAGSLLARRLFGNSRIHCDYINVPTTVFTPLEYGCIGLAEEDAEMIFGQDNIEVYHTNYTPLEFAIPQRDSDKCYAKLVVNKSDQERVVGLHVLNPNAGEITQGYAVAMKLGAKKSDFDNTVGIHPTCSEAFTTLSVTKSSDEDASAGGC